MPPHALAAIHHDQALRSLRSQLESLTDPLDVQSLTAGFIGMDTGGMSRIVRSLGIEPQRWGRRDKHLEAVQVLQIARVAQRASLEEVAGSILDWTERNHPDAVQ